MGSSDDEKKSKLTPAQKRKMERVMREFYAGTLKSSSGKKVTSKQQALAIAFSEARKVH